MCTKSRESKTKLFQAFYNNLNFTERKELRRKIMDECGVSDQAVWRWADGTRFPKKSAKKGIAKACGKPYEELFTD